MKHGKSYNKAQDSFERTQAHARGDAIECLAHEAGGLRSFDVSREGGDEATVVAATRHEGLVVWRGLGRGQQPS